MVKGIEPNYDFINKHGTNPIMIGILLFIVVLYYFVINFSVKQSASVPTPSAPTASMTALEITLWVLFIVILVLNGVRYFYDIDITTSIQNIFSREPEVDINVTRLSGEPIMPEPEPEPVPEIMVENQVFHIPGNKYTFTDAKAICAAYGSKLASYDQVENAYQAGGEWCGYGWSKDQMALYPTQKKTYNKLQTIKGHEHDCGRPGINGGYIANPNVKFGVNCYGHKPKMTPADRDMMELQELYPKTKDEKAMDKKILEWRNKLSEIIVSPFNKNTWSKM